MQLSRTNIVQNKFSPKSPIRVISNPKYSSVHARTYAGREGIIYGLYQDGDQVLAAVVFPRRPGDMLGLSWVDVRDLVEVKR